MAGVLIPAFACKAKWLVTVGNAGGTVFGFISGSIGAVAPATYRDHAGVLRNVMCVSATDDGGGTFTIILRLDGTPPNTDNTFTAIVINGTRYTRASAAYGIFGGTTYQWAWTLSPNSVGTSGTARVTIS